MLKGLVDPVGLGPGQVHHQIAPRIQQHRDLGMGLLEQPTLLADTVQPSLAQVLDHRVIGVMQARGLADGPPAGVGGDQQPFASSLHQPATGFLDALGQRRVAAPCLMLFDLHVDSLPSARAPNHRFRRRHDDRR